VCFRGVNLVALIRDRGAVEKVEIAASLRSSQCQNERYCVIASVAKQSQTPNTEFFNSPTGSYYSIFSVENLSLPKSCKRKK